MKKLFSLIILGMFLISFISADMVTTDKENYNFFDNFFYKLNKQTGLFTAAGQSRSCDINARLTITQTGSNVYYTYSNLVSAAGCSAGVALIDTFDSSWHFLSEYRSEDIFPGNSGSLKKTNPGYIEIYCCPYKACNSNSDCSVSPARNYGNTCNTNYGSCYSSTPTYSTQIYKCISGAWVSQGTASYGQSHFCATEGQNNYIDQTNNEHCASSPSSAWCTAPTECIAGNEVKCVSANEVVFCKDDGTWGTARLSCPSGQLCQSIGARGNLIDLCYTPSGVTCDNDRICEASQGENIDNCFYDCEVPPVNTCTDADTDNNGSISRAELGSYISLWISGSVSRGALGTVISAWANGC